VTESRPRIFTREDGRERIGLPFWNGVLSALGAVAIGFAAAIAGAIALVVTVMAITGRTPSVNSGHPLAVAIGVIFYAACGALAWRQLRTSRSNPIRKPTGRDIRVILIGVAALVLVRIAMVAQLMATHQTKHVQAGLENFDVVTKNPTITAISVSLTVFTLVVLGPIIEEIFFAACSSERSLPASASSPAPSSPRCCSARSTATSSCSRRWPPSASSPRSPTPLPATSLWQSHSTPSTTA
jgi:hypothetical protein